MTRQRCKNCKRGFKTFTKEGMCFFCDKKNWQKEKREVKKT